MNLEKIKAIAAALDPATVQSFVHAVRLTIDAALAEGSAAAAKQTPDRIDYAHAGLDHGAPAGGWLDGAEIRHAGAAMTEAIAAEKWVDGFVIAVRAMMLIGAI